MLGQSFCSLSNQVRCVGESSTCLLAALLVHFESLEVNEQQCVPKTIRRYTTESRHIYVINLATGTILVEGKFCWKPNRPQGDRKRQQVSFCIAVAKKGQFASSQVRYVPSTLCPLTYIQSKYWYAAFEILYTPCRKRSHHDTIATAFTSSVYRHKYQPYISVKIRAHETDTGDSVAAKNRTYGVRMLLSRSVLPRKQWSRYGLKYPLYGPVPVAAAALSV